MGVVESKDAKYLNRFTAEEKERISNFLKDFPGKTIDKASLKNLVGDALPERLIEEIYVHLGKPDIECSTFVHFLAVVLKGSVDERKDVFLDLMTSGRLTVLFSHLKEFLNDVSSALYQQLLTLPASSQISKNWRFQMNDVIKRRLRKLFVLDLCPKDCETVEEFSIPKNTQYLKENLKESSLTFEILSVVYHNAFVKFRQGCESLTVSLPTCSEERVSSLLDLPSVLLVNHYLPPGLQRQWRLLYSSDSHGAGFSTLLNRVLSRGPTVVVVRDKGGATFGGFADVSWKLKPFFVGGANCFVFTVAPKLALYPSTGYNSNYMYLCQNQITLPNGLGFGGQLNNFGLWLDSDFNSGHSTPACATYQSRQLSSEREFLLDTVEVWGVGPPVDPEPPKAKRSVLDQDMTAKALLTVVDKIGVSDGIREEDSRIEKERKLV